MSKFFDFSTAKMRCSGLYYLVAPGNKLTPKQQYEQTEAILLEETQKYNGMGERLQGMANGLKKAAKIAGLEYQLKQLEPKKHIDPLSQTAKSYLKSMYGEIKYGKQSTFKDKGNKYTEKGKLVQPQAIELISGLDKVQYIPNEERISNDFISGIPDCFLGASVKQADYIPDVKASWNWDTFSENLGEDTLNPIYWWQDQGYMWLSNSPAGEVSYCLISYRKVNYLRK